MHRSTRLWRLAIAFLVVVILAVAARFARAGSPDASASGAIAMHDNLFLPVGQR